MSLLKSHPDGARPSGADGPKPIPAEKFEALATQPLTRYPALDGWRGVAVLAVLLYHLKIYFLVKFGGGDRLVGNGLLGVDMFFVLSGYLITGLFSRDMQSGIRVRRFYVRRVFKILPSYVLVAMAGLTVNQLLPGVLDREQTVRLDRGHLCYIFFCQNYVHPVPALGHMWSLAVEEHFYLVFPWILWVIWRTGRDESSRWRHLAWTCIGIMAGCNATRFFGDGKDFLSAYLGSPIAYQTTLYRFDALACGCLLKSLEKCNGARWSSTSRRWGILFFLAGAALYAWLIRWDGGFDPLKWHHVTLAYLAPALWICSTVSQGRFSRILLENGWIRWIGRNSYGIYLWHLVFLFPFLRLHSYLGRLTPFLFFAATVLAGFLSTSTLERFFLKLRDRRFP